MADDPFVRDYEPSELAIAAEFLTNWLPFLSDGLCDGCSAALRRRVESLRPPGDTAAAGAGEAEEDPLDVGPVDRVEPTGWAVESPKVRMSWADMAQEDELEAEAAAAEERGSAQASSSVLPVEEEEEAEGKEEDKDGERKRPGLSREQREEIRFKNVTRKKDFICLERVGGKIVNILEGLELHTGVFSAAEQKRIVDFVYELQEKGRNNQLGDRTYSEPRKWMRGKGRVTIQFGCCYNYATDKDGNPPGILQDVAADPVPHLFKVIIRRLVRWHVLPASCVPDSCIVNIYEPGDCIPPHIDSHDFVRPFSTVSFLSECNILFGSDLKIAGAGEFVGSTAIPLPVGSVLVLNGNGADIAKHCVPAVPTKRISITFRKMDETKRPASFQPEADLQNIEPLAYDSWPKGFAPQDRSKQPVVESRSSSKKGKRSRRRPTGIKSEPDVPNSQPLLQYQGTSMKRSPLRIMDGLPAVTSGNSERGSATGGSSIRTKLKPDVRSIQLHQGDADGFTSRSTQQRQSEEESKDLEGSKEHNGRKVRMEQRRILISCNTEGEEKSHHRESGASKPTHSRISVRSLNNGHRRVRVSLSDN